MMTRQLPIIAVATAPGKAGVGVVRISGKNLEAITKALFQKTLKPRQANLLTLRDLDGQVIDQLIAIYFSAPASFTGEDVLELQCHGGPQLLELVMRRCLELGKDEGLVIAEPGEFSLRAYLNNKIDLAQAEAIADLIDAQSEAAVRGAARSLQGAFSDDINALIEEITQLRILVESTLDFPEEEIEFLENAQARERLSAVKTKLQALRAGAKQGKILRDGIQLVLAGAPNVGKSSLLNRLAGEEVAIVTPIAGTTRDVVQQTIQIEGVPVHVIDTAGLREGEGVDEVEQIGIARAWGQIEGADAVLFLHDLTRVGQADYDRADADIATALKARVPTSVSVIDVWNKADAAQVSKERTGLTLSARTGQGLQALRQQLLQQAGWQQASEGLFIARERHVQALHRVREHLDVANAHLAAQAQNLDLLAEELRLGQNALNEITGQFSADDLLGVIFSSFCIGK